MQLSLHQTLGRSGVQGVACVCLPGGSLFVHHSRLDSAKADRPDRRTARVARELARYNIDIAVLSETRLAGEGHLNEKGAGYTYFWSGRKQEERREAGVGFAIRSNLVKNLTSLPKGINDRLVAMQLPLSDKKQATIISAYAPTMTNPDETKAKFYEELDTLIKIVPRSDKLLVLGDFNARVGSDHIAWDGIKGKHSIGRCNSNGRLLLQACSQHNLIITNTLFQQAAKRKTTWMHPKAKALAHAGLHHHQEDRQKGCSCHQSNVWS